MAKLFQTLAADAEQFAAAELPELRDVPALFHGLLARLEAELPQLAEHSLEDVLAKIAPQGAPEQPPQGGVVTEPGLAAAAGTPAPSVPPAPPLAAPAAPAMPDAPVGQPPTGAVAPSESAGTAAGGAPSEPAGVTTEPAVAPAAGETRVERLRREADEAEAEEIQAEANAGTAAGAAGGAVVTANGEPQPAQSSGA